MTADWLKFKVAIDRGRGRGRGWAGHNVTRHNWASNRKPLIDVPVEDIRVTVVQVAVSAAFTVALTKIPVVHQITLREVAVSRALRFTTQWLKFKIATECCGRGRGLVRTSHSAARHN